MSKEAKIPQPVDLWVEDYYERTPTDLFATDLKVSPRNYAIARKACRAILPQIQTYIYPHAMDVMSEGPAVWAVNHLDIADPPTVGIIAHSLGLPQPRYLAMAELLGAEHPHVAAFIASLGTVPIDRARMLAKEQKVVKHTLRMADHVLKVRKEPLIVFPEGGIMPKPYDYKHRVGEVGGLATTMARRAGVPLVVWGLGGTRHSAINGINPLSSSRIGVYIKDVYDQGTGYPTDLELRMRMQTAATISQTLSRKRS